MLRRRFIALMLAVTTWSCLVAQTETRPVYIVNGLERDDVRDIPEENIESVEMLPSDEAGVARYGERANNGIVVIRLKYDYEASFLADTSFEEYIRNHTDWDSRLPTARFAVRYTVEGDGKIKLGEVLVSTDARFERRVRDAIRNAPGWKPAMRDGHGVASSHVLQIQLPLGKALPDEPYVVLR